MELELILTELLPFELGLIGIFWIEGYGVCLINFFYSIQRIYLKLCVHVVNTLKVYIWVFDAARIYFDGITTFKT